ncbi:MerR family transcriptional regulator [Nocardiopsis sp. HNM0947]|uniref:MerR family transcriptional regulator n=1 Tax=Nocardiopsis coralli TaxID=2772213 RepID=A0ABR9P2Z6_9ACTN|nr:MerR family transcriptional regulator [Nocardiopsis coralli]
MSAGTLEGVSERSDPAQEPVTVGRAASLAGVTVRTLHHWDEIGLVHPSGRSPAGYRLYTAADLSRLHRVVVHRELGLSLEETARLLDAPPEESADALLHQRDRLRARIDRLQGMADALDRLAEARESGLLLSAEDQVAVFGRDWNPDWAQQARTRWGHTEQWAQYTERAAERTADDWRRITAGVEAFNADLAEAVRSGIDPGSERAHTLAERHRASIAEYFDCTRSMHVIIGRMYAEDPGFRDHLESLEPGTADWLRTAIDANARHHGLDPDTATWG